MKTVIHQADGSTQTYSGGNMTSSTPAATSTSSNSSPSSSSRPSTISTSSRQQVNQSVSQGGNAVGVIDMNQYTYLSNLAGGNDGNAIWAQNQLANNTVQYSDNEVAYLSGLLSAGGGTGAWAQSQLDRSAVSYNTTAQQTSVPVQSRQAVASTYDGGTQSRPTLSIPSATRVPVTEQTYPTTPASKSAADFTPGAITGNSMLAATSPNTPSSFNWNSMISLFIAFGLLGVIGKLFGKRR